MKIPTLKPNKFIQNKFLPGKSQIIQYGSPLYEKSIKLRSSVLRESLGFSAFNPNDPKTKEIESQSIHIGYVQRNFPLFGKKEVIGALFITPINEQMAQIRQVAVAPNCRGLGICSKMMDFAENSARKKGLTEIQLNARAGARSQGYNVEVDQKSLNVIPHYERRGYKAISEIQEKEGFETKTVAMQKFLSK